jgi:hypothetical protein
MRYILIIYLVFTIVFDCCGEMTQLWNVIYFAVQYLFAFSIAMYFMFTAKHGRLYFIIPAAFFGSLALNEMFMLHYSKVEYFYKITESEPYLTWGITFILITAFLIILKKLIR